MKKRDLAIIAAIYILAYVVGYFVCRGVENICLKFFVFDLAATAVTFIFSVILKNSSVYDAYWSLTPMVMSIWLFAEAGAGGFWQILFLVVFNIWSLRLTLNWVRVFTDFSYEDWRYRKYRDESPKLFWPFVNFGGIHLMPTLIVFAGMLPLFSIAKGNAGPLSLVGMAVIIFGTALEFFADRDMHTFLESSDGGGTGEKTVCRNGLWKYSRHPNYLGEISVWAGVYLSMIFYDTSYWWFAIGFASVAVMFNIISIPLMEKRQLARRPEYADYRKETSRLLLWPGKH